MLFRFGTDGWIIREIKTVLNDSAANAINYDSKRLHEELCQNLQTIFDAELERGNSICHVDRGWEKMDLVIRFREPLDLEKLAGPQEKNFLPGDLKIFETTDPHYENERSVISPSARQSLSGPIADVPRHS